MIFSRSIYQIYEISKTVSLDEVLIIISLHYSIVKSVQSKLQRSLSIKMLQKHAQKLLYLIYFCASVINHSFLKALCNIFHKYTSVVAILLDLVTVLLKYCKISFLFVEKLVIYTGLGNPYIDKGVTVPIYLYFLKVFHLFFLHT